MKITDLKDTVEMMQGADYKERFKAEYYQLKIRWERLKAFCTKIEAVELEREHCEQGTLEMPKHDCPTELLREQLKVMGQYLHILEVRAVIEGIEL